jgi:dTDP-4-dehydrorhamnose 3,5-epimerase-like enzyme
MTFREAHTIIDLKEDLRKLENHMEWLQANIKIDRENIELEEAFGHNNAVASSEAWIVRYTTDYFKAENEAHGIKAEILRRTGVL